QVEPAVALIDNRGESLRYAPAAAPPDGALQRDSEPPGTPARRSRDRRASRRGGQIMEQRGQVRACPGSERGTHPFIEFLVTEPAFREGGLQSLHDGVPVLIRG